MVDYRLRFDYRLYLLDASGAIQATEEFTARNDGEACVIGGVVADAASDQLSGYEIWSFARLVFSTRSVIPVPPLEEISRNRQAQILDLENCLQRSRWELAKSRRLLERTAKLHGLLDGKRATSGKVA